MTPVFELQSATVSFADRVVLDDLDLTIDEGEFVALVGANGCGKSTLLRTLSGEIIPQGVALLDGHDLRQHSRRAVARRVAVLPQHLPRVPGLTVRQLVAHGRFPQRQAWSMLRSGFDETCAAALAETGTSHVESRLVDTLSGGERQRVRLALALAQDAPVLLLDEPTTFLDMGHQLEVLDLVARLHRERKMTVVAVLHDLEHAARYADRIIALAGGRIVADGAPEVVATSELLRRVFNVRGRVETDPSSGRLVVHTDAPIPAQRP